MDPMRAIWILLVGTAMVLTGTVLTGVSMIARAEIALVIAQQGRGLDVLAEHTCAALVLVSAMICLLAPWVRSGLLRRWPPARRRHRRQS